MRLFLLIFITIFQIGCNAQPWVKPYERDKLADPLMSTAPNPIDSGYLSHVYQSREASRGAEGTSGGGCGCN